MQSFELSTTGEVAPGEAFQVTVASKLATGMRLTVEVPTGIILLASENLPAPTFGGAGTTIYRFRCERVGEYTILFKQGRPWATREEVQGVAIRCRSI